jgi:hypothetical protein
VIAEEDAKVSMRCVVPVDGVAAMETDAALDCTGESKMESETG